jgi:hypothetical protein
VDLIDSAGKQVIGGGRVIGIPSDHRLHDAQIVRAVTETRQEFADPQTALPARREFPRGGQQPARNPLGSQIGFRRPLARVLGQQWLFIE